jgi:hypothetical protein
MDELLRHEAAAIFTSWAAFAVPSFLQCESLLLTGTGRYTHSQA